MEQQTQPQTHTLDSLKTLLARHKPQLAPILDGAFQKLADPATPTEEISEQLKRMLQRDITPAETDGARTFTWRNPSGQEIILTIPRHEPDGADGNMPDAAASAANDASEATDGADQEAATDAAPTDGNAADATEAPDDHDTTATDRAAADDPTAPGDANTDQAPAPEARVNLLAELDALLDKINVHLLVQRTGARRDGQNVLSVTFVPQAKDDKTDAALLTPVNLTGTPAELETGLVEAIRITEAGNRSIEQALAELENAKKEAAEAKKAEAAKARKTATKTNAKTAPAKSEKKDEKPPAPSLFDANAKNEPENAEAEASETEEGEAD